MATAISYSGACLILLVAYVVESGLSPFAVLIPNGDEFRFFWRTARRGLANRLHWGRVVMAKAGR